MERGARARGAAEQGTRPWDAEYTGWPEEGDRRRLDPGSGDGGLADSAWDRHGADSVTAISARQPQRFSSELAHVDRTDSPGRPSDTPQHHPPPTDDLTIVVGTIRIAIAVAGNPSRLVLLEHRRERCAHAGGRCVLRDGGQVDRLFEKVQRAEPK